MAINDSLIRFVMEAVNRCDEVSPDSTTSPLPIVGAARVRAPFAHVDRHTDDTPVRVPRAANAEPSVQRDRKANESVPPPPPSSMPDPSRNTRPIPTQDDYVADLHQILSRINRNLHMTPVVQETKMNIFGCELSKLELLQTYHSALTTAYGVAASQMKNLIALNAPMGASDMLIRDIGNRNAIALEHLDSFISAVEKIYECDAESGTQDENDTTPAVIYEDEEPTGIDGYEDWPWRADVDGIYKPPVLLCDGGPAARKKYYERKFKKRLIKDDKLREIEIPVLRDTPWWVPGTERPKALTRRPDDSTVKDRLRGYAFLMPTEKGVERRYLCRKKDCNQHFRYKCTRTRHENQLDSSENRPHLTKIDDATVPQKRITDATIAQSAKKRKQMSSFSRRWVASESPSENSSSSYT